MFNSGNVVKWRDDYYIVCEDDDDKVAILMPFNINNVKYYPSQTWPSKSKGYKSIEYISATVNDYIRDHRKIVVTL